MADEADKKDEPPAAEEKKGGEEGESSTRSRDASPKRTSSSFTESHSNHKLYTHLHFSSIYLFPHHTCGRVLLPGR